LADLYSKVTLRPRSKLERLVELLEPGCDVPLRPKNGLVTQLVLYFLIWGEASPQNAAQAVKGLLGADGQIENARLTSNATDMVESICSAGRSADVTSALQLVARLATDGVDAIARRDPEEARRRLATLPRLAPDQIDFLLAASGTVSTVAPTAAALRVASRVGYPGSTYASIARSLDAELPEGDPLGIAWRAHHILKQHGMRICREVPACGTCRAEATCSYAGHGDDPASKLAHLARSTEGAG
jgi:endonuclease III